MSKQRLTDTLCKKLPAPDRRHRIYYDDAVPMFGLCVTAKGARSFLVRYRRKSDGRERSMVIGDFPTWTTAQARDEAKRIRRDIDVGADPLAEIERVRGEPTLREVAERDWNEIQTRLRPSTLRTLRNQLDRTLARARQPQDQQHHRPGYCSRHAKIVARGSRIAANRTVRNVGAILSRAIERGERAEPNPARGFKKMSKEQKRERFLSPAELERFRAALDAEADRQAVNALKLIWSVWVACWRGAVGAMDRLRSDRSTLDETTAFD